MSTTGPITIEHHNSFGLTAKKGDYSHDKYAFRADGYVMVDLPIWLKDLSKDIPFGERDENYLEVYKSQLKHYGLPSRASKKAARTLFKREIAKQGETLVVPQHLKDLQKELFETVMRKNGIPEYAEDNLQYLPAPYDTLPESQWPFRYEYETEAEYAERKARPQTEDEGREDSDSEEEDQEEQAPELSSDGSDPSEADTSIESVGGKRKRPVEDEGRPAYSSGVGTAKKSQLSLEMRWGVDKQGRFQTDFDAGEDANLNPNEAEWLQMDREKHNMRVAMGLAGNGRRA